MAHSEPSRNLWFSAEEDVPEKAFEKAKDNQVVVHVGCFAGLFRKKTYPTIPVPDRPVRIHLSDPLHVTKRTGVFGIVELPQALIKYYAWCKNKYEPNDSIVTEAFFMEKLSPLGLAPKVYYYSDYFGYSSGEQVANLFEPKTTAFAKSNPKILMSHETKCSKDGSPPVLRFMIMERLGMSVSIYAEKKQRPFLNAMKLGAQMISLLKKLHSYNIVHGDAHWGNFVFKCHDVKNPSCGQLVMVDFGRSKLITPTMTSHGCESYVKNKHIFASKWEMKGCPCVYRDDVYRAVQNSAMAMYKGKLWDYIADVSLEPYTRMKNYAHFFEVRDVYGRIVGKMGLEHLDLGRGKAAPKIKQIRPLLDQISVEVSRTIPQSTPDGIRYLFEDVGRDWLSKPNYDLIINAYREIVVIIEPSSAGKSDDEIFRIKRT